MINNSLHIGKWIYNILNNNIQDLNIYPVIATEGTECPYCVYWRTGIQASNLINQIDDEVKLTTIYKFILGLIKKAEK